MSFINVYLIIDLLSEKVMHTFYAPNYDFAARKFGEFLDTLKGRSVPSDFALQYVDTIDCPETMKEVLALNKEDGHEFESGVDVLRYLDGKESEDESEN